MSYLNILIGLGGTGVEVTNDFLKITNRYPLQKNKYEWFVLDSASLEEKFTFLYNDRKSRFIQLEGFNSSREVISGIKKKYPESNIGEIFPSDDFLAANDVSSHGGAWEIRKLGFLLLLYHLIKSENNIFDRIINSLGKYKKNLGMDDDDSISGIKIYIINSIAGGTGSGLFLPFAGFLKDIIHRKILKQYDEFPLNVFSFLALPNFVAKGSRAPHSDKTINKYQANAFEAFLEIEKLISKNINWIVKLTDDYEFNFSPGTTDSSGMPEGQSNLIDNFFLFNDKNVERSDIVISNVTGTSDEYKPYFQEMAWCLYFLCCGNASYYENGPGNDLNRKGFAGMGILPTEFPKETIINRISNYLFLKTPYSFEAFLAKEDSEIRDNAVTFKPSFFSYMNDRQKDFNKQSKAYRYDCALGKNNLQAIQNKRPDPIPYEDDTYLQEYSIKIYNKVQQLLTSGFSIRDIYYFLKYFKKNIENEQAKNLKELNGLKDKSQTTERDLTNEKNYKKLIRFQTDLFSQYFRLKHLENYYNLLERVLADIDRKSRFFSSIIDIFSNDSIVSGYKIKSQEYFSFPPPFTEIGYNDDKINGFQNEVLNEMLVEFKTSGHSGGMVNHEDYEKEFLKDIWLEFSKDALKKVVEENFRKFFEVAIEEFNANLFKEEISKDLLVLWFNFIKKFMENYKDKFINKRNTLKKMFNEGKLNHLSLSYPFIPLQSLVKDKKGKKAIFCNEEFTESSTGTDSLEGYEQATKYPVLSTDCLLLMSSLVADKRYDDLELSDLEKSYEIMLKEDERNSKKTPAEPRRYVFIDPRFGEEK